MPSMKLDEVGITKWVELGGTKEGYRKVLKIACARASLDYAEEEILTDEVHDRTMYYISISNLE